MQQYNFDLNLLKNKRFFSCIFSKNKCDLYELLNYILYEIQNDYDEIFYFSKKNDSINYLCNDIDEKKIVDVASSNNLNNKLFIFDSWVDKNIYQQLALSNNSVILLNVHCMIMPFDIVCLFDYIFQFKTNNSIEIKRIHSYFFNNIKSFYELKSIFEERVCNTNEIVVGNLTSSSVEHQQIKYLQLCDKNIDIDINIDKFKLL